MPGNLAGFWWLVVLVGPLIFFQRRLHYETQAVFLLITQRKDLATALFSLLYFPGVVLHEVSHYLMARLLKVPTRRISLIPRATEDGRLQLGYVETGRADLLRDALIGAAPLLTGVLALGYIGLFQLGLQPVWEGFATGASSGALTTLTALPRQPDFWLWFYLAFAVSSTMFPSSSDRRAWLPLGLIGLLVLISGLAIGAGPWMLENLVPYVTRGLGAVALVFMIALGIHLILVPPAWALRRILSRLTGFNVVVH